MVSLLLLAAQQPRQALIDANFSYLQYERRSTQY